MEARKANCPVCGEHFELEPDLKEDDTVYCPACGVELKIVKLYPVELEEASSGADDYEGQAGEDDN